MCHALLSQIGSCLSNKSLQENLTWHHMNSQSSLFCGCLKSIDKDLSTHLDADLVEKWDSSRSLKVATSTSRAPLQPQAELLQRSPCCDGQPPCGHRELIFASETWSKECLQCFISNIWQSIRRPGCNFLRWCDTILLLVLCNFLCFRETIEGMAEDKKCKYMQ